MSLTKIDVNELSFNPFERMNKDWFLVSSGTEEKWNTMTASWGAVGIIWGKPAATTYIRKSRYTKEFVDANEFFTISFLKDGHRDALSLLGSKSGRDINKMADSGLTSKFVEGQPTFEEADLVLVCRKRSKTDIAPEDMLHTETHEKWYADKDYHTMYIGEIVAAYQNK